MILYLTYTNEDGMAAAITDEPCGNCGWPETILHIEQDGTTKRGCASCEVETEVTDR